MKYLNSLITIISISAFFSCNSNVKFGISQEYKIGNDENENAIEKYIIDNYEYIINVDTLNIPLNKYIYSKKYKIYVGVSFKNKANELYQFYKKDTLYNIQNNREIGNTISIIFKKKNQYYYSFLYDSQKDKYTYVLTLESDSTTVRNKFDDSFLQKKIHNDE